MSVKCGIIIYVWHMEKQNGKYQQRNPELRIQGVSKKTHDEINNIAKNLGVSISTFLRPKLTEIAASFPDKMKQPPVDY